MACDTLIKYMEKPVLLAPTKTVPKESVEKNVNIEVSNFVREVQAKSRRCHAISDLSTGVCRNAQEPGFEIFAAISTLLVVFYTEKEL